MRIGGRLLWINGTEVYGLPEDRLFYVGSLCNAEFTTRSFVMPASAMTLNAAIGYYDRKFSGWWKQGYIMAEVLDADGNVIPGYEKEKCVIREIPDWTPGYSQSNLLGWAPLTGKELAGERVSLRFYFRDARIYSLTVE